ncbi:agmatinase [Rhizobium leguminosarum]|uniref:Agmatinase n=1 Tax=Rhizobium leguminosarum TaxID=384 RepID=A0A1B1CKC4_RHILE|nr:agmatinase [Rhizobium leguminosarum]ANP90220.1 agmatinase [Rhizobium leguminosarum]
MTTTKTLGLIGLPYDANSSFMQGPGRGPEKIREALRSNHWNLTTENGMDLNACKWRDFGDMTFEGLSKKQVCEHIETRISETLKEVVALLSLGGDHSVSFPVIKAHSKRHAGLNVLHIDAHPDLYADFENNPYSHASPFARLLEERAIKRLVQVGIRTLNTPQKMQARKFGVEMIEMKDWRDDIELAFDGPLYISLDLDGLDPAFAPGVSHIEPGGFSTRQVIDIIAKVKGTVVGADVVELNPIRDPGPMTATVAAKLVKELFGRMA